MPQIGDESLLKRGKFDDPTKFLASGLD